jgi:hypothetical protein
MCLVRACVRDPNGGLHRISGLGVKTLFDAAVRGTLMPQAQPE